MKANFWGVSLSMLFCHYAVAANTSVNVVGLYTNKAVVIVNHGKPESLVVGQVTSSGVRLISANSERATFEIEGKRQILGMGQAASVAGAQIPEGGTATLYADSAGHHTGEVLVNNYASLKFVVDTGATAVSMNSVDAQRAGINYKQGERIPMQTASGNVVGYHVVINTLKFGSLTINQVDAVVLEGNFPSIVLMGMTALNRLEMKREGLALTLTKKF